MAGDVMWGDRLPGLSEEGQIRTLHSSNFDFTAVESHSLQSLRLVEKEGEAGHVYQRYCPLWWRLASGFFFFHCATSRLCSMICGHLTADCHQIYQAQAKRAGTLVSTVTVKGCCNEEGLNN